MTDWSKDFPITTITREDVCEAAFSEEQASQLTDGDMQSIAAQMAIWYCEHGFWTISNGP